MSIISCGRTRLGTRSSAAGLPRGLGCRSRSNQWTSGRTRPRNDSRSRTRLADCGTSLFAAAALEVRADRVAVGHTRDDQAETFLLKLIRGAGMAGLGGIYPQRGDVIRPLLDVSRSELRDYLDVARPGVGRGRDQRRPEESPQSHPPRVLPELNWRLEPIPVPAIARAAGLVREDGHWLDELAESRFERRGHGEGRMASRSMRPALDEEPPPIQRRILLRALRMVGRRPRDRPGSC